MNNMRRFVIFLIFIYIFGCINVFATAGPIKQDSVIKCGKNYYGFHANPKHWHIVKKVDNTWVSVSSEEVLEPTCYGDIENDTMSVKLSKCVDGDTIKVIDNKKKTYTVRFLAIDTPELSHSNKEVEEYAKKARDYTCDLLEKADKITLEFDKNSDKEDKYERLLAYVYADNIMVQKKLLEKGYAKVAYLYDDYTYTEDLKKIEDKAKNSKVGIWKNNINELMYTDEENDSNSDNSDEISEIFNIIWDFIEKIVSKLFEYFESMI